MAAPRPDGSAIVLSAKPPRRLGARDRDSELYRVRLADAGLEGGAEDISGSLGGLSLGRPYAGGSFSLAREGAVAFTLVGPDRPADVALVARGAAAT